MTKIDSVVTEQWSVKVSTPRGSSSASWMGGSGPTGLLSSVRSPYGDHFEELSCSSSIMFDQSHGHKSTLKKQKRVRLLSSKKERKRTNYYSRVTDNITLALPEHSRAILVKQHLDINWLKTRKEKGRSGTQGRVHLKTKPCRIPDTTSEDQGHNNNARQRTPQTMSPLCQKSLVTKQQVLTCFLLHDGLLVPIGHVWLVHLLSWWPPLCCCLHHWCCLLHNWLWFWPVMVHMSWWV